MRARKSWVSSTLEIFLAAKAAVISTRLAFSMWGDRGDGLFDHFGDEIKIALDLRGNRLKQLMLIDLGHSVFPQAQAQILGVRHRLYAFRVHGLHLLDHGENTVQFV